MRRKILIALLALGTFVGYGSAIGRAVHHHRMHHGECAGWHHGSEDAPPPAQP
jgi:hypothetical protein